jgi:hypothetical protein
VPRTDQAGRPGQPERHEQQARLVHVLVVGIDDDDLHRVTVQQPPQPVSQQRPAGAAAQDHDSLHSSMLPRSSSGLQRRLSLPSWPIVTVAVLRPWLSRGGSGHDPSMTTKAGS